MTLSIKLSLLSLLTLSVAALGVGCSSGDDGMADDDQVSAEEALRAAPIQNGTFKLYATPRFTPTPGCDVHTSLTLAKEGGAHASLREVVGGFCEIYVDPQPREYRLKLDHTSCGSKIYKGKKKISGTVREITITDHRSRLCRDLTPAKIIVAETNSAGDVTTKYSFDGQTPPPPPTSTWLTIAPKQCGTNPWNGAQPAPGQDASSLAGEAGEVDNFFRGKGVAIEQVGFAYPAEPMMVCMACSCPRGDSLVVHAKTPADADKLIGQYGFVALENAWTRSPTQCGSNPWENGQQTQSSSDESHQLATWAAGQGAALKTAGFLDFTEPRFVCMACSCPRGDLAVVVPKDNASSLKLENLGFSRVEN